MLLKIVGCTCRIRECVVAGETKWKTRLWAGGGSWLRGFNWNEVGVKVTVIPAVNVVITWFK